MSAHTRTMAACLADAERPFATLPYENRFIAACNKICDWQRAKACSDQREAMCIPDDKTADELSQLEHEARVAARAACEAVGIDWRNLGGLE